MPRLLFKVLTVLSLLLCAAVCVLWARSYSGVDHLVIQRAWGGYVLISDDGTAVLMEIRGVDPATGQIIVAGIAPKAFMPYFVPAAFLAAGAWIFHRAARRPAARAGLCPRCGYDLRATPGRCPECGTPAEGLTGPAGAANQDTTGRESFPGLSGAGLGTGPAAGGASPSDRSACRHST